MLLTVLISLGSCSSNFNRGEDLDPTNSSTTTSSTSPNSTPTPTPTSTTGWQHRVVVNGFAANHSFAVVTPKIAYASNGLGIAVWRQTINAGAIYKIYVSERAVNGTWSLPTTLADYQNPDNATAQSNPDVAINASGEAIVVWRQADATTTQQLFKAERSSAGVWTKPTSLTDNISPDAGGTGVNAHSVALNNNGLAIIAWTQTDGATLQTFKAERAANGTWTIPANLADNISPDGTTASTPFVALNNNNVGIIAWDQSNGTNHQIFKAERASNGTWTIPANLNDNISPDGQSAVLSIIANGLALNSNNEAIITWLQSDGAKDQVFKAERASNGTWTVPANLADNISPDGAHALQPEVRLNSNGVAIIVWSQNDGAKNQAFKAERAANGTWTLPANLADNISPNGQDTSGIHTDVDPNNKMIVTWYQSDGTKQQAFKAERATNGTWTIPANLADNISPDGTDVANMAVAFSPIAGATILWRQSNAVATVLFKAESDINGTWTIPANSSDDFNVKGYYLYSPQVALNNSGQAIALWGSNVGLFKSERSSTGVWTNPTSIANYFSIAATTMSTAQVALNSLGQAIVVWTETNGANNMVYKAERAANGTWTYPVNVADKLSVAGQTASTPQVALNDNGEAIVAWQQSDGANTQIFKAERAANGTWTVPANLADNISPDGQTASGAKVAFNANGIGFIAWQQSDGTNTQAFKADRAANGTWTVPASLADNISPDGQGISGVGVSLASNGFGMIIWAQPDGTNDQIFKAERATNGTWTVPANLADNISPDNQDTSKPYVAVNGLSQAVVTWAQSDGTNLQIFKAERATNGTWTLPSSLADNISVDTYAASSTKVALNASGESVIYWSQFDGLRNQYFYATRSSAGTWTLPAITDGAFNSSTATYYASGSTIFMNDNHQIIFGYTTYPHGMCVSEYTP